MINKAAIDFYNSFLSKKEKSQYLILLIGRSSAGALDVLGVLCIGYLGSSIASFISNRNNQNTTLEYAGLQLPAITAGTLPLIGALIILIFVAKSFLSIFLTKAMAINVAGIEARAATMLAQKVLGGSLNQMKKMSLNELIYAVQVGSSSAFTGVLNSFANICSEGFLFLILSVSFFSFNPWATVGMLLYFAVLAVAIQVFVGKRLSKASTLASEKIVEANTAIADITSAFRELTVSGHRKMYFDYIFNARKAASRNVGEQTYLSGMPRHIIETGLIIGLGIFIFFTSFTNDLVQASSAIAVFLAGGFRIVAALLPLQNALVNIKISAPQAKIVWDLFKLNSAFESQNENHALWGKGPVDVRLENVSFNFPDNPKEVISEVSFHVPAGQVVAIIGSSGAGKSTLADLILGLELPTKGSITINGLDANAFIQNYPGAASYVPQKTGMLSGTLLNNIAIGETDTSVDSDALRQAIEDSHLAELLSSLRLGIHSDLGKHKDSFSGGQLQRIGLARALYTRPGLIVLDEATSALDAESEYLVAKSLFALRGKVTIVTIAHRLNSIQNADLVIYVSEGRIAGAGTLRELQENNKEVADAIKLMSIESTPEFHESKDN